MNIFKQGLNLIHSAFVMIFFYQNIIKTNEHNTQHLYF
ncbi:hypothetical protein PPRY_a3032 [Pseudoalteromonas prydzensis ACAM 620]|nr:hypothetical protein [Pseudoalteromonas prydzensis ACAM 620]